MGWAEQKSSRYEFPVAVVTKYHKLEVSKNRNVFSHGSGSQKLKQGVGRATLPAKGLGKHLCLVSPLSGDPRHSSVCAALPSLCVCGHVTTSSLCVSSLVGPHYKYTFDRIWDMLRIERCISCPPFAQIHMETLTSNVTLFRDRVFKIITVK